ncbi:MAG: prepilin-type N-terminal cleavage/methylation domain-containing protein [Gammaproteobacteria bacterium]|nr:prepilin-type N-terminal cleavage/methylation domain-containing protein [Gammaproteobacteria bacterium]
MNITSAIKNKRGFTLIEVMVALLVLALGILGISKLQGTLIRNSSDADQRVQAMNIAQKKLDDLRTFVHLYADIDNDGIDEVWSATTPMQNQSFAFIDDNKGGTIASGAYEHSPPYKFTLTWDVTPYYYPAVATPASVATATIEPHFKQVTVNVAWEDVVGNDASVALSTIIDAYQVINSATSNIVNQGGNSPKVPYIPKSAPDVIPVSLETDDDLKKETDKPLPDLSKKGASTSVQFQTVTYNTLLDTVKIEGFKTVGCLCRNSGGAIPTNTIIKGKTIWNEKRSELEDIAVSEDVKTILKTNVDNSGGELQDADCLICCRDSADVADTDFKACRLKRINGVFRLFDPWKMIAFNLIPASYFDASAASMTPTSADNNIQVYSDYVTARVRANLALTPEQFELAPVDTSFAPDDFEGADGVLHRTVAQSTTDYRIVQARAVYMDYPPSGIADCASCAAGTITGDAAVIPLDRVSFNEVNITQLAGWVPDRDNTTFTADYATQHDPVANPPGCAASSAPARNYVTNDEIKDGCEQNFNRGWFFPVAVTDSDADETITSMIYTSNDGVVDRKVDSNASAVTATIKLKVN